ncbi:lantibiotic dehydratase C-terminal domain-containing protein [Actinomadura monticuli]|uniref:Lantibiotic dehydratase C-terminal domain-containing protein n=1 Tax=Actinomadura monticuli TaxID=3097367 RepID=A0ABV4Q6G7_9ACTN
MSWRAVHVYAHTRLDVLVKQCLPLWAAPYERSFFIRYWQGGPHLRLRVDLPRQSDLAALRARIIDDLAAVPATDTFDGEAFAADQAVYAALEGSATGPAPLVPDGTVIERPYEPEYGKYGGPVGVEIAESLFVTSSRLVLAQASSRISEEAKLLTLLTALRATAMPRAEMLRFLDYYQMSWSNYVTASGWSAWGDSPDVPMSTHTKAELLLRTPVKKLNAWGRAVAEAFAACVRVEDSVRGALTQADPLAADWTHQVLIHYIHTHFNRMGVLPEEEARLGHLAFVLLAS